MFLEQHRARQRRAREKENDVGADSAHLVASSKAKGRPSKLRKSIKKVAAAASLSKTPKKSSSDADHEARIDGMYSPDDTGSLASSAGDNEAALGVVSSPNDHIPNLATEMVSPLNDKFVPVTDVTIENAGIDFQDDISQLSI